MQINRSLTLFLLLISGHCFALPTDKTQAVIIHADQADINQKTGIGEYRGNVTIDQGSTHITGNIAYTYMDKKNRIQKAIVKGKRAHYWTLTDTEKPTMHAYGLTLEYYPKQHKVVLITQAEVQQGKDTFRAPHITYDTLSKHVISTPSQTGRTTITFYPEKTA